MSCISLKSGFRSVKLSVSNKTMLQNRLTETNIKLQDSKLRNQCSISATPCVYTAGDFHFSVTYCSRRVGVEWTSLAAERKLAISGMSAVAFTLTPEKNPPLPTRQEARWVSDLVWILWKIDESLTLAESRIKIPRFPAGRLLVASPPSSPNIEVCLYGYIHLLA